MLQVSTSFLDMQRYVIVVLFKQQPTDGPVSEAMCNQSVTHQGVKHQAEVERRKAPYRQSCWEMRNVSQVHSAQNHKVPKELSKREVNCLGITAGPVVVRKVYGLPRVL